MKYGIASYHRPACKTVETLLNAGVDREDIIVSVQTEEDFEEYSKTLKGILFYEPKDCAAGNRNTILDLCKEPIWLLDDDISSFGWYSGKGFKADTPKCLEMMDELARLAKKNNVSILGMAPTSNAIIAKNRLKYSQDCLLQGSAIFVNDLSVRFNDKWKMVEDYELSLRVMELGGKIIRANYITANKPQNGTNAGGLHERYANGELKYWIKTLSKTYPQFKPNKEMTGGMIRRG